MSTPAGCPRSEVSSATGWVGAAALAALVVVAILADLSAAAAALLFLAGTALAMVLWDLLVEKVHCRTSTGLDFSLERSADELIPIVVTKSLGLFGTWGMIGLVYFAVKYYAGESFTFYFLLLKMLLPGLIMIAPVYLWATSRRMIEPRDGLWQFGRLLAGHLEDIDRPTIENHLRSWGVKAFFLAFMMSILPAVAYPVVHLDPPSLLTDPTALPIFLVRLLFLVDVCLGTIGYILTLRPLDSHIRTANPFLGGWVAALICYPPFAIMGNGGPMDYRAGSQEWTAWFAGMDGVLIAWGALIVVLAFIYAWATVAFGIRFSNLTHRGIITNGPYRYLRHPAYVSKNLFWWLIHLPFLSTVDTATAAQNCILLLLVNVIYFLRAKTEERHLMEDPTYRAYVAWMEVNGLLPRLFAGIRRRLGAPAADLTPTA